MSILVDENTRLIVQGITGGEGRSTPRRCSSTARRWWPGVTPGKGGTTHVGVPVFDTVAEAVQADRRPTPP